MFFRFHAYMKISREKQNLCFFSLEVFIYGGGEKNIYVFCSLDFFFRRKNIYFYLSFRIDQKFKRENTCVFRSHAYIKISSEKQNRIFIYARRERHNIYVFFLLKFLEREDTYSSFSLFAHISKF